MYSFNLAAGIMSCRASYNGCRYGSILSFISPGRKPSFSPASTAGRLRIIFFPASQTSGLVQALRILKGVKGISFVELNKKDIVRHKLVERIVDAYEKFDKEAKAEREKRKNEQLVINGERPVKQVNN